MAESKGESLGLSFLAELFASFILLPFKLVGEAVQATAQVAGAGKSAMGNMKRRAS